jgi:flagellar biosynthesis protein FliQ
MTEQFVIHIAREAFFTMLLISGPVLAIALLIGLSISVFQAATSIQEFTLTFVPKIIGVFIVIVITFPWAVNLITSFTINLFNQIPFMGQ